MLGKKVGIDLGTACVRLHVKGEGTVVTEPAVVAAELGASDRRWHVVALGSAALEAAERGGVELRPALRGGSLGDPLALTGIVHGLLNRACGRQRIFKPDVMVAVPSTLTGPERRAVLEVCARATARTMYLVDAPLAAALGAGLRVQSPTGRMVVDVGAGTVDAAVIAAEGMTSAGCLRRGGAALTADIARHLSATHGVEIPAAEAEIAKRELGGALPFAEERTLRLRWPWAPDGAEAHEVVVSSTEVREAMASWLGDVVRTLQEVIADAPGRLIDDVRRETGVLLCGAAAQLRGLDRHLGGALGLRVRVAADPGGCAARGTGAALEALDIMRRSFLYVR